MTEQPAPTPWINFDPEAPLLAFYNEADEKLVEFRTKQDFDDWAGAVQTLTELQQLLEQRRDSIDRYTAAGRLIPGDFDRRKEIVNILSWLETKRSGNDG